MCGCDPSHEYVCSWHASSAYGMQQLLAGERELITEHYDRYEMFTHGFLPFFTDADREWLEGLEVKA